MPVYVLSILTGETWEEAARFNAASLSDALAKAEPLILPSYGNGPIRMIVLPPQNSGNRSGLPVKWVPL